jgi:hypothetical protein
MVVYASLKAATLDFPALGQKLSPGMRPGVAVVHSHSHFGPPVEPIELRHVGGIAEVKNILGIKGRHEERVALL